MDVSAEVYSVARNTLFVIDGIVAAWAIVMIVIAVNMIRQCLKFKRLMENVTPKLENSFAECREELRGCRNAQSNHHS